MLHTAASVSVVKLGWLVSICSRPNGPRGGVEVQLYSFMTSALDGSGWSASRHGRLYPRERPGTHCTGGWVGLRAGLDRCRGELSYLAPLGSENISAPYFKQCFFRGGVLPLPQTESNTTPPSPKTEITNILFYILNFATIIKFKM